MRGDPARLAQVIEALVNNALKHSPPETDISIRLVAGHATARISVQDRGAGIPEARRAHIFERFYRAHTGTTVDRGGMGVELYLAREIALAHGGDIWFDTEEEHGTTFFVTLPLERIDDGT